MSHIAREWVLKNHIWKNFHNTLLRHFLEGLDIPNKEAKLGSVRELCHYSSRSDNIGWRVKSWQALGSDLQSKVYQRECYAPREMDFSVPHHPEAFSWGHRLNKEAKWGSTCGPCMLHCSLNWTISDGE